MQDVVTDLTKKLGNSCTLTHKHGAGGYDPTAGETTTATVDTYPTHSAQYNKFAVVFGTDGANTNLSGMESERVIIPWFGHMVDTTWEYNGHNITDVSQIESDNEVIYFTLTVGEKR